MLSRFSRVQLFVTLCPVTSQAPLSVYSNIPSKNLEFNPLEWVALPSSRGSRPPHPGIEPTSLSLLHWQVDSLPLVPLGKPIIKRRCGGNLNWASGSYH